MDTGRVTIYAVTWNNEQFIEMTVRRIHETTSYPFRLVVSENKSENSPSIREKLISLKEQGLIDKLYLYDGNYVGTSGRYTIEHDEPDRLKEHRSFYVRTDHDAYITSLWEEIPDWLEHYAQVFDDKHCDIEAIRMASNRFWLAKYFNDSLDGNDDRNLRGWIYQSKIEGKLHNEYAYLSKRFIRTNNHFQAVTERVMKSWFTSKPNSNPVDGVLEPWLIKQKNMHVYTPAYVENLSIYQQFPDPKNRISLDPDYVKARKKVFGQGKNELGYNFYDYAPQNITYKIL